MEFSETEKSWFVFANSLIEAATSIFNEAKIPKTEKGAADPRVVAVILLARSLSNFRGAIGLLQNALPVEARILTRCCYENLFWISGLTARKDAFVKEMLDDERKSRRNRVESILARMGPDAGAEAQLREQLRNLNVVKRPEKFLNLKSVASGGPLDDAYLIYSQLSADAAHPSISALGRYVVHVEVDGKEDSAIDLAPCPQPGEVAMTLDWACNAIVGVCVGVNQIVEGTPTGERLSGLMNEYRALESKRQGVA